MDRQVYQRYKPIYPRKKKGKKNRQSKFSTSLATMSRNKGPSLPVSGQKAPTHEMQIRKKLQVLWGDNPILANYFPVYVVGPFQYLPFKPGQGTRPSSQAAAACSKLCASGEISAAGIRVRRIWRDCSHSFGLQAPAEAQVLQNFGGQNKVDKKWEQICNKEMFEKNKPCKKNTLHVLWVYWDQSVISGNVYFACDVTPYNKLVTGQIFAPAQWL